MRMIRKIKTYVKFSEGGGLFHNSRQDVNKLAKVCNELTDKVNELVQEVNELKKERDGK